MATGGAPFDDGAEELHSWTAPSGSLEDRLNNMVLSVSHKPTVLMLSVHYTEACQSSSHMEHTGIPSCMFCIFSRQNWEDLFYHVGVLCKQIGLQPDFDSVLIHIWLLPTEFSKNGRHWEQHNYLSFNNQACCVLFTLILNRTRIDHLLWFTQTCLF